MALSSTESPEYEASATTSSPEELASTTSQEDETVASTASTEGLASTTSPEEETSAATTSLEGLASTISQEDETVASTASTEGLASTTSSEDETSATTTSPGEQTSMTSPEDELASTVMPEDEVTTVVDETSAVTTVPTTTTTTIRPVTMRPDCLVDIGFVLDGSGSVGIDNWMLMIEFVKREATQVEYGIDKIRFGVISFGNFASLDIRLDQTSTISVLSDTLDGIRYKDENTNTAAGLRLMRTELFNVANGKV